MTLQASFDEEIPLLWQPVNLRTNIGLEHCYLNFTHRPTVKYSPHIAAIFLQGDREVTTQLQRLVPFAAVIPLQYVTCSLVPRRWLNFSL